MARRTLYLPVMIAAAVAVTASLAVALLAVSEQAEATFPGKNGRIAYSGYDGNDYEIFTINSRGGSKINVTNNYTEDGSPEYSPSGKKIAYTGHDGTDSEIYTINVGGGDEFRSPTTMRTTTPRPGSPRSTSTGATRAKSPTATPPTTQPTPSSPLPGGASNGRPFRTVA
jgi:hypothetical protein